MTPEQADALLAGEVEVGSRVVVNVSNGYFVCGTVIARGPVNAREMCLVYLDVNEGHSCSAVEEPWVEYALANHQKKKKKLDAYLMLGASNIFYWFINPKRRKDMSNDEGWEFECFFNEEDYT